MFNCHLIFIVSSYLRYLFSTDFNPFGFDTGSHLLKIPPLLKYRLVLVFKLVFFIEFCLKYCKKEMFAKMLGTSIQTFLLG